MVLESLISSVSNLTKKVCINNFELQNTHRNTHSPNRKKDKCI